MKFLKNLLAFAAVMVLACASSFAIDYDSAEYGKLDNMSRRQFEGMINDLDDDEVFELICDSFSFFDDMEDLEDFFFVPADEMDEDDEEAYDYLIDVVRDHARRNDVIVTFLIDEYEPHRSFDDDWSGWVILSHYMSNRDIESYVYYFAGTTN